MTRSLVLTLLLACSLTAAPVPKTEKVKAEDVTDTLVELVAVPAVQRELKLTADQRVSLIDGFDTLNEQMENGSLGGVPAIPPSMIGRPGVGGAWDKYHAGRRELVASVLTKAQFTRLQQCEVRALGLHALLLPRVSDAMNFNAEQKGSLEKAIAGEGDNPASGGQAGGGFVAPLGVPTTSQQANDSLSEMVQGFTLTQAKVWKELTGDKVGFDRRKVIDQCPALFGQLFPPPPPSATPANPPGPIASVRIPRG